MPILIIVGIALIGMVAVVGLIYRIVWIVLVCIFLKFLFLHFLMSRAMAMNNMLHFKSPFLKIKKRTAEIISTILVKKFFVLDGVGDFWYNKYGIIIMGGSQNAIKKAVDLVGIKCAQ